MTLTENKLDIKVLEFLNTHFKNLDELDKDLESIFNNEKDKLKVMEQELQANKQASKNELDDLEKDYKQNEKSINIYSKIPDEIEKQYLEIIDNEPAWLKQIVKEHKRNHNLKNTIIYFETTLECLTICNEAEKDSTKLNICEIPSYNKLLDKINSVKQITNNLITNKPKYPNLLFHLEYKAELINTNIQKTLISNFETSLNEMKWPNTIDLNELANKKPKILQNFMERFIELIRLQIKMENNLKPICDIEELLIGILPIDILFKPLIIKFRYHFMSSRATNSLEKPEWFLSFIMDLIKQHLDLFDALEIMFTKNNINQLNFDFKSMFLLGIRKLVQFKLNVVKQSVVQHAPYLTHFIKELLEADNIIINNLLADYPNLEWNNFANIYLSDRNIFKSWISAEKEFVEQRLNSFINTEGIWDLINKDTSNEEERPTIIVEKVITLFDAIIERYQYLNPLASRIRYFTTVQISLLEIFFKFLEQCVNKYEGRFKGFRPLGAPRRLFFSFKSVDPMRGVIDSIHFLLPLLSDWDCQPFFLEIWEAIYPDRSNKEIDSKGLFEDLNLSFTQLISRVTTLLSEGLFKEFINHLDNLESKALPGEFNNNKDVISILENAVENLREHFIVLNQFHILRRNKILKLFCAKLDQHLKEKISELIGKELLEEFYNQIINLLSNQDFETKHLFKETTDLLNSIDLTATSKESFKDLF